jgi:TPR repeat protein
VIKLSGLLSFYGHRPRRYFERAAAQGHPEGLYNMGVFHANGQAGLPRDPERAHDFFNRAANAPVPFPMALHAMGNIHNEEGPRKVRLSFIVLDGVCVILTHLNSLVSPSSQNLTLARQYFEKAAEVDSADGHFSLAMMLREGTGGPVDIPQGSLDT